MCQQRKNIESQQISQKRLTPVSYTHLRAHETRHDLVCEIFLWPESWRGTLYMYLFSFPRFWTLSIERFWFLFWSILNGVTLKISNNLLNSYWSLSHPNQVQWNLDLTKCQGTGDICSLYRGFVLYRTPPFNEFLGKQANCWL